MSKMPLHLFAAYGIECEYMLVAKKDLSPQAISDDVLSALAGTLTQEVELGQVAWSNELVLHVLELKANGPHKNLGELKGLFYQQIKNVNTLLTKFDAMLLPTAMHPFLDPEKDTRLWPHGDKIIYETYNRIFSCKGHGWSNLQSVHINLPFANDEEFGRLHAAIRMCLPLLPAIAASSPVYEGKCTNNLDNRLLFYRENQKKVPSITGHVIPEAVFTPRDYDETIFKTIYQDIAAFDTETVLQEEWLNSRGAIARFDRNAIEIRVLDIQECLRADFAIIAAVVSLVHALVDETFISYEEQKRWPTERLAKIFNDYIEGGVEPYLHDKEYAAVFGFKNVAPSMRHLDLWSHIANTLASKSYPLKDHLDDFAYICKHGNLSQRLLKFINNNPEKIQPAFQNMATCLEEDRFFG